MSIVLGNMYAKFWKPLCMKFVKPVIDSRVLTFIPRRQKKQNLSSLAARLDEVVTSLEISPKNFHTIRKLAKN